VQTSCTSTLFGVKLIEYGWYGARETEARLLTSWVNYKCVIDH